MFLCVFLLLRPRADAHSLTAGLGGDASRRGGVFFFLLRPRPDRGGGFFFAVAPPGRSLTHCGLGRFRQGPGGVFFFRCGPAEPGEPITKNVWCTTSGVKRPGGAAAKTKTPLPTQNNGATQLLYCRASVYLTLRTMTYVCVVLLINPNLELKGGLRTKLALGVEKWCWFE